MMTPIYIYERQVEILIIEKKHAIQLLEQELLIRNRQLKNLFKIQKEIENENKTEQEV
jgi:hypothetical protein